ncbi:acid phosphatase [Malassezia sp. CBS 17886]|nr:acid phosphatase [Malassezia sp. CBS 17886]
MLSLVYALVALLAPAAALAQATLFCNGAEAAHPRLISPSEAHHVLAHHLGLDGAALLASGQRTPQGQHVWHHLPQDAATYDAVGLFEPPADRGGVLIVLDGADDIVPGALPATHAVLHAPSAASFEALAQMYASASPAAPPEWWQELRSAAGQLRHAAGDVSARRARRLTPQSLSRLRADVDALAHMASGKRTAAFDSLYQLRVESLEDVKREYGAHSPTFRTAAAEMKDVLAVRAGARVFLTRQRLAQRVQEVRGKIAIVQTGDAQRRVPVRRAQPAAPRGAQAQGAQPPAQEAQPQTNGGVPTRETLLEPFAADRANASTNAYWVRADGNGLTAQAGAACEKEDISAQTLLFLGTIGSLFVAIVSSVVLLYREGTRELPGTLASVSLNGYPAAAVLPRGVGRLSDTLGWVPPPTPLALEQVVFVLRHGERAPTRTRLRSADPPIPMRWNFCHASHHFDQAVLRLAGDAKGYPSRANIQRRVEFAPNGTETLTGGEGDCLLAELTDVGRLTMLRIGMAIRRLYVDKLALLPPTLQQFDSDKVYFRTTHVNRTKQSLEQVITGVLGMNLEEPQCFVPKEYVRNTSEEDLLPNPGACASLMRMMGKAADEAATVYNPQLRTLDDAVTRHMEGAPPRVDGRPRVSGIVDTIRAARAHGLPTPTVFAEPAVLSLMENAIVHEWFAGYQAAHPDERRRFRRLAMGPFLGSLYDRFAKRASQGDADPLRLSIYLGHDASLVGILSTLDCFNGRWPDFSASLCMELFRGKETQGDQHYVRSRYGDETLIIPGCAARDDHYPGHPELCTLAAFRRIVCDSLQPADGASFAEECQAGE